MFVPIVCCSALLLCLVVVAPLAGALPTPQRWRRTPREQLEDMPDDPWDNRRERLKVAVFGPSRDQVERLSIYRTRKSTLRKQWSSEMHGRLGDLDCSVMRCNRKLDDIRRDIDSMIAALK